MKSNKKETPAGGNLEGQTFLFTGTLVQLKRSEAEELVEANGGKLLSGVSSKLNYLVVGEDAGSKLEKAKKITSIRVITEQEFLQLIGR
jgi:DNA ligase (NAD+)